MSTTAKANNITTPNTAGQISSALNDIGARLAGVCDSLRLIADGGSGHNGNILHMLADVCEDANYKICELSGDVSSLGKGGA